jgi:large conductance mechanosensitive channel
MKLIQEFKAFIMRGNIVELAVAFVVGAAFVALVNAFVNDILTPLIAIPGKVTFADYYFKVGGGKFLIGAFLNSVVAFLMIAAAVFFFVVKPLNALNARRHRGEAPADPTERDCPYCLSTIPIKATRCKYCTAEVPTVVKTTANVTA